MQNAKWGVWWTFYDFSSFVLLHVHFTPSLCCRSRRVDFDRILMSLQTSRSRRQIPARDSIFIYGTPLAVISYSAATLSEVSCFSLPKLWSHISMELQLLFKFPKLWNNGKQIVPSEEPHLSSVESLALHTNSMKYMCSSQSNVSTVGSETCSKESCRWFLHQPVMADRGISWWWRYHHIEEQHLRMQGADQSMQIYQAFDGLGNTLEQ